mgnify:FL=1
MKLNKTEIREIAKELAEQAEDRMDDIFTEVVMDMVHYGDHEDDDLHEDDNEMGLSDKDYNAIFKAAFTILGDKKIC